MATIGTLALNLVARTSTFDKKMKASGRTVTRFSGTVQATSRRLLSFGRSILAVAGVAGMGYMIRQTLQAVDKIAKMSDELRISTEALASWEHAAKISGTSIEALHKGLEMFVRRLGEASQGFGEGIRGLEMLKMSAEDLINLGPEKAFLEVVDAISKLPNAATQAGAAYNMFGRQGVQLLNMIQQGKGGLEELRREAERLGLTFDRIDARKVEEANDAFVRTKAVMTGAFRRMVVGMAPALQTFADALTKSMLQAGEWLDKNKEAVKAWAESVVTTIDKVAEAFGHISIVWGTAKVNAEIRKQAEKDAREMYRSITSDKKAFTVTTEPYLLGQKRRYNRPQDQTLYDSLVEQQMQRGDRDRRQRELKNALSRRAAGTAAAMPPAAGGVSKSGADAWASPSYVDPNVATAVAAIERRKQAIDAEMTILGRLNETRERSRDIVAMQTDAEKAYGKENEMTLSVMTEYKQKLTELESAQRLKRIADSVGNAFGKAFEDMVMGAKTAAQAVAALATEVARLIIRQQIAQPLARGISSMFQGAFGPGNSQNAPPDIFAGPHHRGGIVGPGSGGPKRRVPAALFMGAPRLHNGLMSDEFPAILQRGEQVIPKGGGGLPAVQVNIQNQTGAQMSAETGDVGFDGEKIIINAVVKNFHQGGEMRDLIKGRQS